MRTAHDVVAAYWAAAEARDWQAFGDLVADDVLYRGPQAMEQVRGRQRTCGSTPKASRGSGT
jgi:ketosteroid isomerase-like protein